MPAPKETAPNNTVIELPEPQYDSDVSIEQSLLQRRSIRSYSDEPLTLDEISQLLWAAQGITNPRGFRTAPSAGALYPLEIYVAVGNVTDLPTGTYKYNSQKHRLVRLGEIDVRDELAKSSLGQACVREGAVDIVIAAVYERTTVKYGDRGVRYVHMEAGHAAQNMCLQAVALNLGTVTIGAFHDNQVRKTMGMPENEVPLYVMPVGRKS